MKVRRTAVVVAALAAVALTGCANQAGDASTVGSQSVSDRQVADVVDEVQKQDAVIKGAQFDQKAATQASLTMQTRHLILDGVAAQEGITVTQGEVDTFLNDIITSQYKGDRQALLDGLATQSAVPASQVDRAARDQLIYNALLTKIAPGETDQNKLSTAFGDYMKKYVATVGVEVSPRFGTWNVFALGPVPDDLSTLPPAPLNDGLGKPAPLPAN